MLDQCNITDIILGVVLVAENWWPEARPEYETCPRLAWKPELSLV